MSLTFFNELKSNILQRTEILKIIKYEINYVINKKRDILPVLFPNNYYSIHLIFFLRLFSYKSYILGKLKLFFNNF